MSRILNRIEQTINKAFIPSGKGMNDLMETVPKSRISIPVSRSLAENAKFSAGRVIAVNTDKPIKVIGCYSLRRNLKNMDGKATSGIDVYKKTDGKFAFVDTLYPSKENKMHFSSTINEYGELHFLLPSYASLSHLYISDGEVITPQQGKKIVCYGSSITQGCAASRPGLNYVNLLYLEGYNTVNYGFSESAKGEPEVIREIASEHADIYVMEYDHNATVEELKKTHENTYHILRSENPDSIILYLSRISGGISVSKEEAEERIKIINATVEKAIKNGDKNVFFLSGNIDDPSPLLKDDKHPNNIGMELFKRRILEYIQNN